MQHPIREEHLRTVLDEAPLREVVDSLPSIDACQHGLCADREPAPAIRMEGRTRLSVLRIYSKSPAGRQTLVGQVQVTAETERREGWEIAYYVHDLHMPVAREVSDRADWWRAVLDRHMRASGALN
ncbi:MAG: hypothetical protein ACT4PT_12625 [Methanobacteriota archaeon]